MSPSVACPGTTEAEITLDVTFAELYAAVQPPGDRKHVFVPFFPSTVVDLSDAVPRAKKYIYHDTAIHDGSTEKEVQEYREWAAAKYLGILEQRFAFAAGDMPLVIFSHPNSPEGNRPWVERTFSRLAAAQRPRLRQITGPADIRLEPKEVLALAFPLDIFDPRPHVVDPEVHYELLSKRSGLCTPRATVFDMVPGTCNVTRGPLVVSVFEHSEQRVGSSGMTCARMAVSAAGRVSLPGTVPLSEYILSRAPPFVVKMQQSVSGGGTWLVTTPAEQRAAAECVTRFIAYYAPKVEPRAEHLRPCSLIVTDFISDVVETLSPALFVQYGGAPVFLGCTEQQMDRGRWVGGNIAYSAQSALQKRVQRTVDDIARFLWSRGYYDPVGADVLEDSKGNQWIVDLNVRTPSSLVLAVLRTHFSVQRNMDVARVIPDLRPSVGRDEFVRGLEDEFRSGAVIVIALVENGRGGAIYSSVVVGAESPERLDDLARRVCSFCT